MRRAARRARGGGAPSSSCAAPRAKGYGAHARAAAQSPPANTEHSDITRHDGSGPLEASGSGGKRGGAVSWC